MIASRSLRRAFVAVASLLAVVTLARAQTTAPAPSPDTPPAAATGDVDSGRLIGAPWEFTNADRDKVCQLNFKSDKTAQGFKLEFDPNCAALFPIVKDIVAWKFAQNDLLRLVDRSGKTLIEFGEVESGIFEAPTPGVGLLFLQVPGSSAPPPRPADDMFGEWTMTRAGKTVCSLTLDSNGSNGRYPVRLRPGCDPTIVQQNFLWWMMEQGELLMTPSRGAPWRFEEVDAANFKRVPEGANPIALTRQ
jgi:hypothetical protein